jgi:hypothetical protein
LSLLLLSLTSIVYAQDWEPVFTLPYDAFPEELDSFSGPALYDAVLSPDGTRLAVVGNWTMGMYEIASGELLFTTSIMSMMGDTERIRWSPDSRYLLTSHAVVDGLSGVTVIERVQNAGSRWLHAGGGSRLLGLETARDGAGRIGYRTVIHDLAAGETALTLDAEAVAISQDERLVVTQRLIEDAGDRDLLLEWWQTNGQQQHSLIDVSRDSVRHFSPDTMKIVYVSYDGFRIVDAATGEEILTSPVSPVDEFGCGPNFPVVAWSGDNSRVLIGDHIYEINTGELLAALDARQINQAHWSADGARILTAGNPGGIWDAGSGALLIELPGAYHMARWDPEETRVFSHTDNLAYVYDAQDGSVLLHAVHSAYDDRWCGSQVIPPTASDDGTYFVTWSDLTGFELRQGGRARVYVEDDGLNLRGGPDLHFDILEKLPSFTSVEIIGGPQPGDFVWWQVRTEDGNEGWVVESVDNIITLRPIPEAMETGLLTVWRRMPQ